MNRTNLFFACSLVATLGASATANAASVPSRLEASTPAESAAEIDLEAGPGGSISGQWSTEDGGHVQFQAQVVGTHAVEVQLQTPTVTATFIPDFDTGRLEIRANDSLLYAEDWRAIVEAYHQVQASDGAQLNPMAGLYLMRTLGMFAESTPGTVWQSRDVALPTLHPDDPSFYDAGPLGDAVAGRTLETLERADAERRDRFNTESVGVLARPPRIDDDEGPSPGEGTPPSSWDGPLCGGEYRTDKANGQISCVETLNYYCIQYDYYPGSIAAGQRTVKVVAPTISPSWSRPTAARVDVYYAGKSKEGAYPCSGRCGPGCDDAPDWVGGGGGWGLGCLIHDQCVYQATGGQKLDQLWEQPKNVQLSSDCGQEMMDAADDHFMPPSFCPGSRTVGGSGKWRRTPPPAPNLKRKNTVSSARTKSMGRVKHPDAK